MTYDLDHLKRIAKAATQGEWGFYNPFFGTSHIAIGGKVAWKSLERCSSYADDKPVPHWNDARHIATFDPPTVLALIARIEELETTNAHQAKVIEHYTARSESLKVTLAMIADQVSDFVYDELASDIEDVALNEWGEEYESDKKRPEAPGAFVNDAWDAKRPNPYRRKS